MTTLRSILSFSLSIGCYWQRWRVVGFWCKCDWKWEINVHSNIYSCLLTFCVHKASYNTNVQTNKIQEWILIISPDEHSQVCDEDVLETANDGGGEGGVVGRAQHCREDQDESKDTREKELKCKPTIVPPFKFCKE